MLTRIQVLAASALLIALPSTPAVASCSSNVVDSFTVTCAVLEDTTTKFHLRISSDGNLASAVPTFVSFTFDYTGNWHAEITTLFIDNGFGTNAKATEIGSGWHVVPPHGEGTGPLMVFSLGPVFENGIAARASGEPPHGAHFDRWTATHFYNSKDQYQFNVFASHTPEPATWAMMVLGFGAVGASLRRRRPAGA